MSIQYGLTQIKLYKMKSNFGSFYTTIRMIKKSQFTSNLADLDFRS